MSCYLSVIFERCLILYYNICAWNWWSSKVTWAQFLSHDFYFNCWLSIKIFETLGTLKFIRHFKCNFRLKLRLLNFRLRLRSPMDLVYALIDHLTWHVLLGAGWNFQLVKISHLQEAVRCQLTYRVVTRAYMFLLDYCWCTITVACRWSYIVLCLI